MVDFAKLLKARKEKQVATTKTKVKGKSSTAIVPWKEKFAGYAKEATEQVKNIGGGTSIKFGPGTIEVGGTGVPGGKLECVVIGSCAFNAWNEAKYNASNPQPPDCYAFAIVTGDKEMKPHEEAHNIQADTCGECDKNVFGSAENGRGKACGNNVRLGLITGSDADEADGIATAELGKAKVSPTNVKHWAGYVKMLSEDYGRPPWAVVTQIQSFPDPKTQIRLEFTMVSEIDDDDILTALEKRADKIQGELQTPFPPPTEQVVVASKKVAANKRFAGKR